MDCLSGSVLPFRVFPSGRLETGSVLAVPSVDPIPASTSVAVFSGIGSTVPAPLECVREMGPIAGLGGAQGAAVGLRGKQLVNGSLAQVTLTAAVAEGDGATIVVGGPGHSGGRPDAMRVAGGAPVSVRASGGSVEMLNSSSVMISLAVSAWPFRQSAPATNLTVDIEILTEDTVRGPAGNMASEMDRPEATSTGPFSAAGHVHFAMRPRATAGGATHLSVQHLIMPTSRPGVDLLRLYIPNFAGSTLNHDFMVLSLTREVVSTPSSAARTVAAPPTVLWWTIPLFLLLLQG